jgi:hypothetical protein
MSLEEIVQTEGSWNNSCWFPHLPYCHLSAPCLEHRKLPIKMFMFNSLCCHVLLVVSPPLCTFRWMMALKTKLCFFVFSLFACSLILVSCSWCNSTVCGFSNLKLGLRALPLKKGLVMVGAFMVWCQRFVLQVNYMDYKILEVQYFQRSWYSQCAEVVAYFF